MASRQLQEVKDDLKKVNLGTSTSFAGRLSILNQAQVFGILDETHTVDGVKALAFQMPPPKQECPLVVSPAVQGSRTPLSLDLSANATVESWKRLSLFHLRKSGGHTLQALDSGWLRAHSTISQGLKPGASASAASAEELAPQGPGILSIFDLDDHHQNHDGPPAEVTSKVQAASFPEALLAQAQAVLNAADTKAANKKKEKEWAKHKKCRQIGLPVCRLPIEKFRQKLTVAVRSICQVKTKQGEGHAYKFSEKGFKDRLMDGYWCFAFFGRKVQTKLVKKLLKLRKSNSEPKDEGIPGKSEPSETLILYLHVSLVLGGLSQFFPVFHLCKAKSSSSDSSSPAPGNQGQGAPAAANPFPEAVTLVAEGKFFDYYEGLQLMDVDWEWTLQIYELEHSSRRIPDFIPGIIEAKKILPPYVVWKGLSSYKRGRRPGNTDPGPSDHDFGAVNMDAKSKKSSLGPLAALDSLMDSEQLGLVVRGHNI